MMRAAILVYILFQWSEKLNVCDGHEIRVSQRTGDDTASCWNSSSNPCQSLHYALIGVSSMNDTEFRVLIMDATYLMDERLVVFQSRRGVKLFIEGARDNTSSSITLRCNTSEAGITIGSQKQINKAFNVAFINLQFRNCGPTFASTVLIWNALNVLFLDCAFIDNLQAPINAIDSSVSIDRCSFINNTCNKNILNETLLTRPFEPGRDSQSGGTGFIFTDSEKLSVSIKNSYYFNNSAVVHLNEFYVSPATNVTNYGGEGGGGISIVFFSRTRSCRVVLDNLTLVANSATYGGGIYLVESGFSQGNSLILTNSMFGYNRGEQAGGGFCSSQWDNARNLTILIDNCLFEWNFARRGAGVNSFFMSKGGLSDSSMKITRSKARRNIAASAAAFRFTSSLPFGNVSCYAIHIVDCEISDHRSGSHNSHTYLAPLTVQRMDIRFSGVNRIMNNYGAGGMVVENGVIHVDGQLIFLHNIGSMGGALRLWSSQIKLYPYSELIFVHNYARSNGGALNVQLFPSYEIIHKYNTDCFITYSKTFTPPSQWKTKVVFERNSAKLKGAAIYVSSLGSCLWDEEPPHYSFNRSLRWNSNVFIYHNNFLVVSNNGVSFKGPEYDIATDTAMITPMHSGSNNTIELYPGEEAHIFLQGLDELQHIVYTIADVLVVNTSHNLTDNLYLYNALHVLDPCTNNTIPFQYFSRGRDSYESMINKTHLISVSGVYSTMSVDYSFTLKSVPCPPGYLFQDDSCTCDKNNPALLKCVDRNTLYIKESFWAGLSPTTGKLVTYYCPFKYCACKKDDNDIPGCILDTRNLTAQCANHREGFLCGKCKKGRSVGLLMYECIDCHGSGWILGVVIVVVVALCVLVIYLNPGMSKDLRGPLYFFQMLPFILTPRDQVGEVIMGMTYLFQFGGPFVYIWKTCITDGITNLYALAVTYVMPIIGLLVFLVAYILSTKRIIRTKLRKTSNLQSFWLIILFMYIYMVQTSLLILHCPVIDDKMVFFYDATVECFHGEHLLLAIIALLVLVAFVIPPPVIIILITKGYWKVDPQYLSTLTDGLRSIYPWWWAVDFGRRIVIVGTFVFIPCMKTKQMWMIIMCQLVLVLHASVQPYKRRRTNVTETVYLFVLCLFSVFQSLEDFEGRSLACALLVILAAVHSGILCVAKFWRFCKKKCHCRPKRLSIISVPGNYRTFDDHSECVRASITPEVQAKQNLFDTVFASSTDSSDHMSNSTNKSHTY